MTSSATAMPLRRRIGQLTAPPAAPHTHAGRRMSARSSFGYGLPAMSCSVARVHCGDAAVWRDLELGAPRLASLAMAGPGCYSGGFAGYVAPGLLASDQPHRAVSGGRSVANRGDGWWRLYFVVIIDGE